MVACVSFYQYVRQWQMIKSITLRQNINMDGVHKGKEEEDRRLCLKVTTLWKMIPAHYSCLWRSHVVLEGLNSMHYGANSNTIHLQVTKKKKYKLQKSWTIAVPTTWSTQFYIVMFAKCLVVMVPICWLIPCFCYSHLTFEFNNFISHGVHLPFKAHSFCCYWAMLRCSV